ncbi:IclR family transcriptional regulator [Brevibacterium sp. GP-SGM9]|uniref:IclR family transcriptional regulator n=1 Tax=Brevibacterium sp. GP-SGM9 TaxID=3376990 RepID=UPI0039A4A2B6
MNAERSTNQSVDRALSALTLFTSNSPSLRVSDVASGLGLGVSTASRLLATLEESGFLRKDSKSQRYELGQQIISLGGVALNNEPIYRNSRAVTQRLAWELGLGANVAVRQGTVLRYLQNVEGPMAPKSYTLLGQTNPLHATGMGKALMLDLSASEREALLGSDDLPAYTTSTIVSHSDLEVELQRSSERGYCTEINELALGRACIAAPIRDFTGQVVAAISLSGALSAINLTERETELARIIIEAADTISVASGYLSPQPQHR